MRDMATQLVRLLNVPASSSVRLIDGIGVKRGEDTYEVEVAISPKMSWVPGTNPMPFIVNVKGPTATFEGLTDANVGKGLKRITVALAETDGAAVLVAVTITLSVLGMAAGGV